jgi:hypothetical protein
VPNVSNRSRLARVFIAAVIGSTGLPSPARGENAEDAAIRRGVELRKAGNDQAALEEFRSAYSLTKSARSLAQIGLAEQALGRWVDAEAHLEEALSNDAQPWIHKHAAVLREAVTEIQPHVGSLEIIGPSGAEARVNGLVVGTLPFPKPVRIPIGTVNVELTKAGFLATSRTVSISPRVLARESIDLAAAPPPAENLGVLGPASTVGATAPVALRREENDDRRDTSPGQDDGQTWHRPLAWGTAAAAVLGVGVGVTALAIRQGKSSDLDKYQCHAKDGTVSPPDPANNALCADLATSYSSWGVTAVVSFSVVGLLAVASGVLFATLPAKTSAPVALACAPNLASPGAVCRLTF